MNLEDIVACLIASLSLMISCIIFALEYKKRLIIKLNCNFTKIHLRNHLKVDLNIRSESFSTQEPEFVVMVVEKLDNSTFHPIYEKKIWKMFDIICYLFGSKNCNLEEFQNNINELLLSNDEDIFSKPKTQKNRTFFAKKRYNQNKLKNLNNESEDSWIYKFRELEKKQERRYKYWTRFSPKHRENKSFVDTNKIRNILSSFKQKSPQNIVILEILEEWFTDTIIQKGADITLSHLFKETLDTDTIYKIYLGFYIKNKYNYIYRSKIFHISENAIGCKNFEVI